MTERRNTITRTWRPAATPAPRVDDFDEIAAAPVRMPERRKQPEQREERRNIGRRLQNWGAWANARAGGGADSMTGLVCDNMLRNSPDALKLLPPAQVPLGGRIDVPDAERINAALNEIGEPHRFVLQWTYVACLKSWGVAGACGFPTREYDDRLAEALSAIEEVVGGPGLQHAG